MQPNPHKNNPNKQNIINPKTLILQTFDIKAQLK